MASTDQETEPEGLWADITTTHEDDGSFGLVRDKHTVKFGEPPFVPFGKDDAPSAGDYLLLATGGCQVEVLKQCFEKARIGEYEISLHVDRDRVDPGNAPDPFPEHTSVRFPAINMELSVTTTPEFEGRVRRCLEVCEDACIMSRSVEAGIDINLSKELSVSE